MNSAVQLIVDAAPRHSLERAIDHLAQRIRGLVVPAMQQDRHSGRVRKLGLAAKSSVHRIKQFCHLCNGAIQDRAVALPRRRLIEMLVQYLPYCSGLCGNLLLSCAIRLGDAGENTQKTGPSVLAVRRKVGAAEEDLSVRREKGRERPAPLRGERLDRALVPNIYVRRLVSIDLDTDEVLVEEGRNLWILVGLAVHNMAPMTPDGADIEEHRFVGSLCLGEGFGSPRIPVDGLVRCGLKVGRSGRGQAVSTHERNLPRSTTMSVISDLGGMASAAPLGCGWPVCLTWRSQSRGWSAGELELYDHLWLR